MTIASLTLAYVRFLPATDWVDFREASIETTREYAIRLIDIPKTGTNWHFFLGTSKNSPTYCEDRGVLAKTAKCARLYALIISSFFLSFS